MPIYLKKSKGCADDLLIYSPSLQYEPILINGHTTHIHELQNKMTIEEFNNYAKVKIIDEIERNIFILEDGTVMSNKQYFGATFLAICLDISRGYTYRFREKGFTWLDIIQHHEKLILEQSKYKVTYRDEKYRSIKDLCSHLKIDYGKFRNHIESRPLEPLSSLVDSFQKSNYTAVYDHLGNAYGTEVEMCHYYSIPYHTYRGRKKLNWTLEQILTTPIRNDKIQKVQLTELPRKDHMGIVYTSFTQMCKHYGKSARAVKYRLQQGKTLEEALTTPLQPKSINQLVYHEQTYSSLTELLIDHSITESTYDRRKRANPELTITEIIDGILEDRNK